MRLLIHLRMTGAIGFLVLWSAYFANDLINRHYHRDSRGNLISHIHFYKNTEEGKDHQHSDEDLFWLDMISNQIMVVPSIQTITICSHETIKTSTQILNFESIKHVISIINLPQRGPPFCFPSFFHHF